MTITKRIGIGYLIMASVCVLLLIWLWHHEFVEEPEEFAALGLGDIHKDTAAEASTVCFLGLIPMLLGLGWWWTRRVLAPLRTLSMRVENFRPHNLQEPLHRTMNGDEVDKLTNAFNSMTARLDESFRRIHEFTLHASHELKTPLTVMHAQLEMALRESASSPPEQSAWLESQLDEVQRLTQIVDSLTLLTKADAGLVELDRQTVHLGELVEEAFEDALILAQPHSVQVTLGPCEDAVITGDRHRLRQLLLILTDNAVKYNHPGGTIEIALARAGDHLELRMTNTGSGPAPKTLSNVFDRFVRGENARGKVEGCGLGLTIAQWIVQAHGGTIQLVAETNAATTALCRFPILASGTPGSETHLGMHSAA